MAEIKWIKISVDMFDNRKIKHIRKLPNGDTMALIWIMLLTMAGRCNDGGMIYLTKDILYTTKMLAEELDIKENIVKAALNVFERFDMIEQNGDLITVTGWHEHQNVEAMDKVREQTRNRVAKHREAKKSVTSNARCNVTVTQGNATDIETEKEEDIERDIESETITPTIEQVTQYCNAKNSKVDPQRFFNYYKAKGWTVGGETMQDWKAMVDCWEQSENSKSQAPAKERTFNTMQSRDDIDYDAIERRERERLIGGSK